MFSEIISALKSLFDMIRSLIDNSTDKNNRKAINENNKINCSVRFISPDENFKFLFSKVNKIYMYTVNSYEILNKVNMILEQDKNIYINEIVIMVRKKDNENKRDLAVLNSNIDIWKKWVENKRINKLKIVSYNHDPDHYYTIFGDRLVFCGQVFFDKIKPTGTTVNYTPLVFEDSDSLGQNVIEQYIKHFENVLEYYETSSILYNSDEEI